MSIEQITNHEAWLSLEAEWGISEGEGPGDSLGVRAGENRESSLPAMRLPGDNIPDGCMKPEPPPIPYPGTTPGIIPIPGIIPGITPGIMPGIIGVIIGVAIGAGPHPGRGDTAPDRPRGVSCGSPASEPA